VEVVGEAACGTAAIEAVARLNPDLMILDVRLPDMFELLRAVGSDTHPLGIMVSTDADQAIWAFAEGAIDYLITPVTAERFDRAMIRARHRINTALPGDGHFSLHSSELCGTAPASPRFLVGERQRRRGSRLKSRGLTAPESDSTGKRRYGCAQSGLAIHLAEWLRPVLAGGMTDHEQNS
jgi:CheY-like chemotaxis protein